MFFLRNLLFSLAVVFLLAPSSFAFEFRGFSDVKIISSNDEGSEGKNNPLSLGQIDFYTAHNIDDNLDILLELVVEADKTGEWVVDLERIQIGYYFSDLLKISAGRFHNVIGYWNANYHHGALLHTTIFRPRFLEFEDDGGVIPAHLTGFLAHGALDSPYGYFTYNAMFGNGSKLVGDPTTGSATLNPNNNSDDNNNKAVTLRLAYNPPGFLGSGVSVFTHITRTADEAEVRIVDVDQSIIGADLFVFYDDLEVLAEVYSINNTDNLDGGTGDTSASAFYAQVGYEFGKWKPYARYEKFTINDETETYFAALGSQDYSMTTGGLKYDMDGRSSIKGEVRSMEIGDDVTVDILEYALQWAYLF